MSKRSEVQLMNDAQEVAEDIARRLCFRDSWPDDDSYNWAVHVMAKKIHAALATARGAGSEDESAEGRDKWTKVRPEDD